MSFSFDVEQMLGLMQSFYVLTDIRLVLFDNDFKEITAYPKEGCEFCRMMKGQKNTRRKCAYADRRACEKSQQTNSPTVYKCHAGLVEAVVPLHENEKIIGYLMFGQLADSPDKGALFEKASVLSQKYGFDKQALATAIDNITCKNTEEIAAAAKLMEACTGYIIYKELITPQSSKKFEQIRTYIDSHLEEDITISKLCGELDIGRTQLYELFSREAKMGVAEYLRRRRLHRAKKLLKATELSIAEIASLVGFTDYNYFSRVYKKTYGKSPKMYRKK